MIKRLILAKIKKNRKQCESFMYQLYNTQSSITTSLRDFFEISCNLRKTQLNILPAIIFGMAISESCITNDIVKNLKEEFNLVYSSSVERRIRRFFNNTLFDNYKFYENCIKHIIKSFKPKHNDKRIHVVMDHMFVRDNFIVFMISLRIGKQSIPLWFRCFKGKSNKEAFRESLLEEGVYFVHELFKNKGYKVIFLGDRWFNSVTLMNYINSLGHTYVFRLKENYKCLVYNKKEGHKIWNNISDLFHYKYKATVYENIGFTRNNFLTNIVIGPTKSEQLQKIDSSKDEFEPWIIITNGDTKHALKDYAYRFGAIEFLFKAEKSNGFFLEKTTVSNIKAFENMYTCICFTYLWMSILGIEYSKNKSCYKNIKIEATKKYKNGIKRVMSLFKTGLFLLNIAYNSRIKVRLPFSFILYDI